MVGPKQEVFSTGRSEAAIISKLRLRLTIGITTKNRWADLEKTFELLQDLGLQECPTILIDDGSDEQAPDTIVAYTAAHSFIRFEQSQGLAEQRNRLAALAKTDYLLSIDDDSSPLSTAGFLDVIAAMDADQTIAAVALPIALHPSEPPPFYTVPWSQASAYVGCGHILRVSTFVELGGYWGDLVYWGEERDYALRLIAAGYKVLNCPEPVIHHRLASTGRSSARLCYYRGRNTILIWYSNAPRSILPLLMVRSVIGILAERIPNPKLVWAAARGILDALPLIREHQRAQSHSRMTLSQWRVWKCLR